MVINLASFSHLVSDFFNRVHHCCVVSSAELSGDGWIKSRQLKSGMQLHTMNGVVPVQFLEPGRNIKTYNLIVDGHHTYFVGAGRVLSHDNSVHQSTNAVVPGLRVE